MDKKIVYTVTVRTNVDGIQAAAVVKNEQTKDGVTASKLTTAFAQEDLDLLMKILDGRVPISNAMGGGVSGN